MKSYRILTVLILFLAPLFSPAQNKVLQGILSMPDGLKKEDSLSGFALAWADKDPGSARLASQEIIRISKKLNFIHGIGIGYRNLGFHDIVEGNYASSAINYKEALTWFQKEHNFVNIASCYSNLADIVNAEGHTDSGIVLRMQAIELLEKHTEITTPNRLSVLSTAYYNLGATYGNAFNNIDKAYSYYRKAEAMARQSGDTKMILHCLHEITYKLIAKHQLKEAKATADEALRMATDTANYDMMCIVYDTQSGVLNAMGRTDEAIQASERAASYAWRANSVDNFLSVSLRLCRILNKHDKYERSRQVMLVALKKSQEVHSIMYINEVYELLAEAEYHLGMYRQAYEHLQSRNVYRDSLVSADNNKIIADKDARYQAAQKEKALSEKQLQLAQKDLQIHTTRSFIYAIAAALIIALLTLVLLFARARQKKRLHLNEVRSIQQQKEIQLLQALMQGEERERSRIAKDLHDGAAGMLAAVQMHFSTLSDVEGVTTSEGYRQGMHLLQEATREIRKTSHNLMPEVLLQHGLDEALRRYCANVTNSRKLHIQYDSWGETDRLHDSFELSIYRIVQELINNILKHSGASQALVQLSQQNGLLSISIEDNGVGLHSEGSEEGMGLRSLQSRIGAMKGRLEVENTDPSGFSVYLEFDITELKKETAAAYA